MQAQAVWLTWRRILREPSLHAAVLSEDLDLVASSLALSSSELAIVRAYAKDRRATEWFISHEYWAEFSSLAQTAFTAFRTADRETRIQVNTTLNRLLAQSQLENGDSNLTVSWAIGSISI